MEDTHKVAGLKCEIVTPEGLVYDGRADIVVVPGEMGELGILPRHAPLVSSTVVGEARVHERDGAWKPIAVGSGYVKMQFDRLLLLVNTAENAVDIDAARAQTALERAEQYLARAQDPEVDLHRAEQSRSGAVKRRTVGGKV